MLPCSCLRSGLPCTHPPCAWVHTAGEPPSAQAGVLWDETKPEDTSWLLRGAQPAPQSPIATEKRLASGPQLCSSGVCPCCPMLASGAKHWRHHPCGHLSSLAEPFLIHRFQGKRCTAKCVPAGQHGRTGNRAQAIFA